MNAIRIKRKLSSDTICIPELAPMIGRDVEIIVLEEKPLAIDPIDPHAFWNGKSAEELAKEQSVRPYSFDDTNRHVFSDEDFDGFEETLSQWRKE
jgi:hypothetical protein